MEKKYILEIQEGKHDVQERSTKPYSQPSEYALKDNLHERESKLCLQELTSNDLWLSFKL